MVGKEKSWRKTRLCSSKQINILRAAVLIVQISARMTLENCES